MSRRSKSEPNPKECTKCHRILPLDCFHKHLNRHKPRCKDCNCAAARDYKDAHRDEINVRQMESYYHDHDRQLAKRKLYRVEHRDKIRQHGFAYRARHSEHLKEYFREYYIQHRLTKISQSRIYRKIHKDEYLVYLEDYRRRNSSQIQSQQRAYRKLHRDKCRFYGLNYLARKAGAPGYYDEKQWKRLCDYFSNRCPCCGRPTENFEADHIIPLTWDGTSNWLSNIQPLCKRCNTAKGNHRNTDYRPFDVRDWATNETARMQS